MQLKRTSLFILAAALVAAMTAHLDVRAANSAPAISAFEEAFSKVNDYEYRLHSHEIKDTQIQDRVYHYWYMKPHFAKTLIESGDGRGSGGVWAGEDRVSGHQGGFLSGIHLKVDLHDGRATSLRGYTIPQGLLQNIVYTYRDVKGELTEHRNAGMIDGGQTDMLDLKVADPASNMGVAEQRLWLSQSTHFPVRQILYGTDGKVVLDQSITDLKLNPGLTQGDFPY